MHQYNATRCAHNVTTLSLDVKCVNILGDFGDLVPALRLGIVGCIPRAWRLFCRATHFNSPPEYIFCNQFQSLGNYYICIITEFFAEYNRGAEWTVE